MSRKLALLIGNSTYGPGLPPLEKPDADIAALAKVLADPAIGGFDDVKPLLDATSATARREVARFFSGRSLDDLLLLYFSGHGLRDDRGGLYLAVQDTETELLSGTAVEAAFIAREMDHCRSQRQILILDCCYSGAFERGAKGPAANPVTAFTGNGLGRFVLTASDSTQLAWEDVAANSKGGLSVFTHHLVRGLESGEADLDGDGLISVDELYDYVYARVVEDNPRQTPGKSTSKQQGEIFLARNHAGPKLRPLPAELMQELEHPWAAVREVAVRELGRFLRGSDAGLAKAAHKAAEQALDDDSSKVRKAAAEVLAAVAPEWAEQVPPSRPARTPKSYGGHHSPPALIPSAPPRAFLRRAAWIALGVVAFLVVVALLFLGANQVEVQAADSIKTQTQPDADPAKVLLLMEAKSWPRTLTEDFDSPQASTNSSFANLDTDDEVSTTKGVISSGVLHMSVKSKKNGSFAPFPANPSPTAADFYLRVDLRKSQGPDSAEAGLLFRMSPDIEHYYTFMLGQKSYYLSVWEGKWRDLVPLTRCAAIRSGQTNSLAVIAKGTDLILFINDQKVDQVSDTTFSSGRVGVGIGAHGIEPIIFDFDNFELRRRP